MEGQNGELELGVYFDVLCIFVGHSYWRPSLLGWLSLSDMGVFFPLVSSSSAAQRISTHIAAFPGPKRHQVERSCQRCRASIQVVLNDNASNARLL